MFEDFEKFTTLMYRPPEMIDRYKKFTVNTQADIWVSYNYNNNSQTVDVRVCPLYTMFLSASLPRRLKIGNSKCTLHHA